MNSELFLMSSLTRAQYVEGYPGHDRRQPPAKIVDILGAGATHTNSRVLDRVVGLRD